MKSKPSGTSDPPLWAFALILALFGIIIALGSCAPHPKAPDNVAIYKSRGRCWSWDKIEAEIVGHTLCNSPLPNGHGLICTRKKGHKHSHHCHGADDCYAVWSNSK